MPERVRHGRLPFGLPRITRPRSASAYVALCRPASLRPPKPDATIEETSDFREAGDGMVLVRK